MILGFPSVLVGLSLGANSGWRSPFIAWWFLLGGAGMAAFVLRQFRARRPLIPLPVMTDVPLVLAFLTMVLFSAAYFPIFMLSPLYMRNVLDVTPLHLGLILTTLPVVAAVCSPVSGRLSDRMETWVLVAAGLVAGAAGIVVYAGLQDGSSPAMVLLALALVGAGVGVFLPAHQKTVFALAPREHYGLAGGAAVGVRAGGGRPGHRAGRGPHGKRGHGEVRGRATGRHAVVVAAALSCARPRAHRSFARQGEGSAASGRRRRQGMMRVRIGISSNLLYSLSAICMASGAIGASMLAPFYMDARGFPLAVVGMPLLVNGVGALASDVVSGTLASYFRSSFLLLASVVIAVVTALLGYAFEDSLTVFLVAFTILGLTEAMFSLAIRRIVFVQSTPEEQGKAQGQVAAALGLGFALGPTMGGLVGEYWGLDKLFLLVALPQGVGWCSSCWPGGIARRSRWNAARCRCGGWARGLMSRPGFLGAWLAIFQSFFCLIGVTRIAFPFLAVGRGMTLDIIGTMVSISRLTDTAGRLGGGWLCDRIGTRRVILLGVFVTVPAFVLQIFGHGYVALLLPLLPDDRGLRPFQRRLDHSRPSGRR